MGDSHGMPDKIADFVQVMSEGELSASQHDALERLLLEDRESRKEYIQALAFEAMLMCEFPAPTTLPDSVAAPPSARHWTSWPYVAAVSLSMAGVAFLALWLGLQSLRDGEGSVATVDTEPELIAQVATVTVAEQGANGLTPGTRLSLETIDLPEGHLEILFDCGAVISMAGPARITLESDVRAFLHFGKLAVDVPKEAVGFIVQTPTSHVRDLGTSFALQVATNGQTELHVLEGSVEATNVAGPVVRTEIVNQEQALLFSGDNVQQVKYEGQRFRRPASDETIPGKFVHWPFDDAEQSTMLDSAGKYKLELRTQESESPLAGTEHGQGVFGGCLTLARRGQYAVSDYEGVSDSRARTIAFWVRIPATSAPENGNCLLSWGVPEPRRKWEMNWNRASAAGQIGAIRVDFGRGYVAGSTDLRDGLWHHVAVVFHGGKDANLATHLKLYVDGKLETVTGRRPQRINTLTTAADSAPVTIGRYIDRRSSIPKACFEGQFDELYIVEGVLTPQQIASLRDNNRLE